MGLSLASILNVIIGGGDTPVEANVRFRNKAPNANFGEDGLPTSAFSRKPDFPELIVNQPLHRVFNFRGTVALRDGLAPIAGNYRTTAMLRENPAVLTDDLRRPRFRLASSQAAQAPAVSSPGDLNPALPTGNPATPALPMLEPSPLIPPGIPQNQPPPARLPPVEPEEPLPGMPSESTPTRNPSPSAGHRPPGGSILVNPTQVTALNQAFSTGGIDFGMESATFPEASVLHFWVILEISTWVSIWDRSIMSLRSDSF